MDHINPYMIAGGAAAIAVGTAFFCKSRGSSTSRHLVGNASDLLEPGKMKTIKIDTREFLLVRTAKGKYRATGTRCPHYNMSLADGIVSGDNVVCKAHAACFSTETGDIEDGPSFDRIPVFRTEESDGRVYVHLPKVEKLPIRETPHMCPQSSSDKRNFVIIGAGPAGHAAAETLRTEGYSGRITMLTREPVDTAYDRVKLSKDMSATPARTALRPQSFYRDHGISVMTNVNVVDVDSAAKTLLLEDGRQLPYDKLVCASGGPARTLRKDRNEIPPIYTEGAELGNIFTLREAADAAGLLAALSGEEKRHVVVIGASFIGMEAAANIVSNKLAAQVTVVAMEATPFERVLGPRVGALMQQLHESKGVRFVMNAVASKFNGRGGVVQSVDISDFKKNHITSLQADVVIIGAGIVPSLAYLNEKSGVSLKAGAPGGVIVDEYMNAGPEDIFAVGDIAYFPYPYATDASTAAVRIEHWDVAIDQGRVAARNMLGQRVKYMSVPFFWTSQFGRSIRSAGYCTKAEEVIVHGNLESIEDCSAVVYYVQGGKVASVVTVAKDPYAVAAMELFRANAMPSPQILKKNKDFDLPEALRQFQMNL